MNDKIDYDELIKIDDITSFIKVNKLSKCKFHYPKFFVNKIEFNMEESIVIFEIDKNESHLIITEMNDKTGHMGSYPYWLWTLKSDSEIIKHINKEMKRIKELSKEEVDYLFKVINFYEFYKKEEE